jgi:hypothetical protein
MKTLKLFSLIGVFALMLTFLSCSKNDDPTPTVTKSNLDLVKAAMTSWTFKSIQVIQNSNGKTATSTTCKVPELFAAGFSDTKWQYTLSLGNYNFLTTTSVKVSSVCNTAYATIDYSTVLNADGTVTITITNGESYNVNVKDLTTNSVKATLIGNWGYTTLITFTK